MAALVYGRRRVGKSELIKQALRETDYKYIYYECKQTTEINNVESLSVLAREIFELLDVVFKDLEAILEFFFKASVIIYFYFIINIFLDTCRSLT